MSKKIKLKKHINEASSTTVEFSADKNDIKPIDLIKELENIEKTEKIQAERDNYRKKHGNNIFGKQINVSKLDKVKVKRIDGTIEEISPRRIAKTIRLCVNKLKDMPDIKVIANYFDKDIIWTFDIKTAATDGIRIAMNPVFADELLTKDFKLFQADQKINPTSEFETFMGRCVQFVFVHEAYHIIYRHLRRELLKPETADGSLHDLANIAQDVEINRDIEYQYPELFSGITEAIEGCYDTSFSNGEMWEQIFDAYYSGAKTPPMMNNNMNGSKMPMQQQGQGQGQQQQNQQQGQQQQGQNGSNSGPNDLSKKSPDYLKGYKDALDAYRKGELDLDNISSFITEALMDNGIIDQEEYDKGYQDAINRIKAIKEQIKQNAQNSQNSAGNDNMPGGNDDNMPGGNDQNGEDNDDDIVYDEQAEAIKDALRDIMQNGEWEVDGVTEGKGFNCNDVLTPEQMQKIAKDAGQPYDSDDLSKDPVKNADDYVRNNMGAIRNSGKGTGAGAGPGQGLGKGNTLDVVTRTVEDMFKPKVDWRRQLKTFFNGIVKTTDSVTYSRKRLTSSDPDMDAGRYTKPRVRTNYKKDGIAQVFHLIDNSGSMYGQTKSGEDVFNQIFSEILTMEKKAHIQLSSMAFFTGNTDIPDSAFSLWNEKTSKGAILNILTKKQAEDKMGGTEFCHTLEAAINKGKPYFNKRMPATLTLIYTDGELGNRDYDYIKELPVGIRSKIVFIIINSQEASMNYTADKLKESFIKESNIIMIDASEI